MNPFEIEELSLNAWPAMKTILYDGWLIRFSGAYSRRANCVNAIYPSSLGIREKIDRCETLYAERKAPAIFKIVEIKEHDAIEAELSGRGYGREFDTAVRMLDLGRFSPACDGRTRVLDGFDEEWIAGFIDCSKTASENHGFFRAIIGAVAVPVLTARAVDADGEVIACAFGALEQCCLGVFDVMVKEDRRGLGYGRSVMNALLAEAKERGGRRSYLQVVRGNSVAEALYESLGYRELYGYHYRKKTIG